MLGNKIIESTKQEMRKRYKMRESVEGKGRGRQNNVMKQKSGVLIETGSINVSDVTSVACHVQ